MVDGGFGRVAAAAEERKTADPKVRFRSQPRRKSRHDKNNRKGEAMIVQEEVRHKLNLVRALMADKGLGGVLFRKQASFAWLTCGGRNMVGIATEIGVASILVTPENQYVLCNNIEAPRIGAEEAVEDMGYPIRSWPWYEDKEAAFAHDLAGPGPIGCDDHFADLTNIGGDLAKLRWTLTFREIERYRELGFMASHCLEDAAKTIRPGDKECSVIGRLAQRLWDNGYDYITTFCAADDRIADFRHPIATETRVRDRAMLCCNVRRWGLIVSFSRFVQFGKTPADIRRRYDANVYIDCVMMANTIPGRPASEPFEKGLAAYKDAGFETEYELHHQGGSIGYAGRDYKVNFQTEAIIQENQAFSWNPSISGSKSEDVMLATSQGPEMLTRPVTYPVLTVEADGCAFRRPDILEM
jgi:Xaa-Pro aminopeptidase